MDGRRAAPFYGWVIVAAVALVLAIGVGITFYGVSIYLKDLTDGPDGFSLTIVSVATGSFLLVSGVAGLGVGALLERFEPRRVIIAGALVAAASIFALGRVQDEVQLVLVYGVLGAGFAAMSVIPASALLASWFTRRRAVAMSVAFAGLPIGGAVMSPVIAALVESLGVDGASPWLALILLVGVIPVSLLLKADPARIGSWPDGVEVEATTGPAEGVTLTAAVRSTWFRLVTLALTLGMLSQLGTLTHLYNAVSEKLDASTASLVVSVLALASLVGRALGGWALSRVVLSVVTVVLLLVQAGAIVILAVAPGIATVLLATVLFGLTMGNMQILQPLLLAHQFGVRDFSRILARGNLFVMVGTAAGPMVVGAIHTASGDYRLALLATAAPTAVAAVLMLYSRRFELTRT
ncbi:MAG: MFS transporter [Aeromicrobium sp.]